MHEFGTKWSKGAGNIAIRLGWVGWGNILLSAYSTASMEDLQSSEWYSRPVKMTTVVADITRTCWVQKEFKGRNACHWRLPSASVIGLTPGGGWVASPCSAPSGAKRAGSHRRSKMLQYLLLWHLGTGQQSKFQSTRKTRGSTLLENPVVCLVEITSSTSGSNPGYIG